jgi:FKBP-type peptidyl-prolyl cis-trans isomerase 2
VAAPRDDAATAAQKPTTAGREERPLLAGVADDGAIKTGDIVMLDYTLTLEDGTLVYSPREAVAKDAGRRKAPGYREPGHFGPEQVVAGKAAAFPGVGQSATGMLPGTKKEVTLSPESAFGNPDPRKIRRYATEISLPRVGPMSPEEFVGRFHAFPIVGKEVEIGPFLKGRVKRVNERSAIIEMLAEKASRYNEDYGTVDVGLKGDQVVAVVKPRIGGVLKAEGMAGRVTAADAKTFTVDFNTPLAGKTLLLEMEAKSVTGASALSGLEIAWIEDHDKGLGAVKETGKPGLMVLYAEWCGWCKRLQNETLTDPRIKLLKDRFVFIKVDTGKQKEVHRKYEQKSFPMIVLFNGKGDVAGKLEGYRDASALRATLDAFIETGAVTQ